MTAGASLLFQPYSLQIEPLPPLFAGFTGGQSANVGFWGTQGADVLLGHCPPPAWSGTLVPKCQQ